MGTQQCGALDLLIADLSKDGLLLQQARDTAIQLLETDPNLEKAENAAIKTQVATMRKSACELEQDKLNLVGILSLPLG